MQRCPQDFTVGGLVAELAERGLKVDYRTRWEFVHAEKLSTKQDADCHRAGSSRCCSSAGAVDQVSGSDRSHSAGVHRWTWTKTNMAPLRGWAPRGQRIKAKVPHGRWQTMTFMAALRHDRITAPWFIEGPINGEASFSISKRFWSRPFGTATSSSWTISARTGPRRASRHPCRWHPAVLPAEILT